MDLKPFLVYLCKGIRSMFNGATAALSIYFYYRDVTFIVPAYIPFSLGFIMLGSTIKSALLNRYKHSIGFFNILLIGYLLQIFPLIIASDINLGLRGDAKSYTYYFMLGFYPFDGQDISPVENVEKQYLQYGKEKSQLMKIEKKYNRVGYACQAVGSLVLGWYLTLSMENYYDEKMVFHYSLFGLLIIALIGLFLTYFLYNRSNQNILNTLAVSDAQNYHLFFEKINRIRLHCCLQGFGYGLINASFLAYYIQLNLNYYYDNIGQLLCLFFLLKGFGRFQLLFKYLPLHASTLKYLNIIGSMAIAALALSPHPVIATVMLIISFPLIHLDKTYIELELNQIGEISSQNKIKIDLEFWEGIGVSGGVFFTFISYSTLSMHLMFYLPFLVYPFVKIVNHQYLQKILQTMTKITYSRKINDQKDLELKDTQQSTNAYESLSSLPNNQQQIKQVLSSQAQSNCHKVIRSIILVVIFGLLLFFYFNTLKDEKYFKNYRIFYERLSFARPKQLRLFNASLAEYLEKQNITDIRLINCGSSCRNRFQSQEAYSIFQLNPQSPKWVHFSEAPYFTFQSSVVNFFQQIQTLGPSTKGFSVFWEHPLRYHKISESIREFIKKYPEKYGFYYEQMPSLNLRGVESKIVLIFVREKKVTGIPGYTGRIPPKNFLGFSENLKLVHHLPEIRQFIIYHLNIGIDKFFLYDNDIYPQDSTIFDGSRLTQYLRQCLRFNHSQKYKIFQQIWEQFYDHIIYFPWSASDIGPLEEHPQIQGYQHYNLYFKQAVRYTSFTDMDEYIYSPAGKYIPDTLKELEQQHNIGAVNLYSHNFGMYICNREKLVIEQTRWIQCPEKFITFKAIVMNNLVTRPDIHARSSKNGIIELIKSSKHDIIMRHYRMTVSSTRLCGKDLALDSQTDDALRPYFSMLSQSCHNKCRDSFHSNCSNEKEIQILKDICAY